MSVKKTSKSWKTLYHIGPRPASPKPKKTPSWDSTSKYGSWKRHWLNEPVRSGVFLSTNPIGIAINHGRTGNVYAYKISNSVIDLSGGVHRYDFGTEILIPEDVWNNYQDEIIFLGKSMSENDLIAATRKSKNFHFDEFSRVINKYPNPLKKIGSFRKSDKKEWIVNQLKRNELENLLKAYEQIPSRLLDDEDNAAIFLIKKKLSESALRNIIKDLI